MKFRKMNAKGFSSGVLHGCARIQALSHDNAPCEQHLCATEVESSNYISRGGILKIAIKGAVASTADIIEMLREQTFHQVTCILENSGAKVGREIAGVRVIPTIEVRKAYREGAFDVVVLPGSLGTKTLASMARELRSMGVRSDDLYVAVSPPPWAHVRRWFVMRTGMRSTTSSSMCPTFAI